MCRAAKGLVLYAVASVVVIVLVWRLSRQDLSLATKWDRWRRGLCPKCGYDLRASTGRCPECGRPIRWAD